MSHVFKNERVFIHSLTLCNFPSSQNTRLLILYVHTYFPYWWFWQQSEFCVTQELSFWKVRSTQFALLYMSNTGKLWYRGENASNIFCIIITDMPTTTTLSSTSMFYESENAGMKKKKYCWLLLHGKIKVLSIFDVKCFFDI